MPIILSRIFGLLYSVQKVCVWPGGGGGGGGAMQFVTAARSLLSRNLDIMTIYQFKISLNHKEHASGTPTAHTLLR